MNNLQEALNGGRGALDAWLEVNNESEVRDAINALIAEAVAKEREACAQTADYWSRYSAVAKYIADAIRARRLK